MNKGIVYFSIFSCAISIVLLIILIVTLSSSGKMERYYMINNSDGDLVRIDKVTGEIMLLDEGTLYPLNDIESVNEELRELNLPKDYNSGVQLRWGSVITLPLLGLRTKWDRMIYLRIELSDEVMDSYRINYTLPTGVLVQLFDKNGFLLIEHIINLDDFHIDINQDNELISFYAFASFECPKEIYKKIDDWSYIPVPN